MHRNSRTPHSKLEATILLAHAQLGYVMAAVDEDVNRRVGERSKVMQRLANCLAGMADVFAELMELDAAPPPAMDRAEAENCLQELWPRVLAEARHYRSLADDLTTESATMERFMGEHKQLLKPETIESMRRAFKWVPQKAAELEEAARLCARRLERGVVASQQEADQFAQEWSRTSVECWPE